MTKINLKQRIKLSLNHESVFNYLEQEMLKTNQKKLSKREKEIVGLTLNFINK